jgi:hypothetical protein
MLGSCQVFQPLHVRVWQIGKWIWCGQGSTNGTLPAVTKEPGTWWLLFILIWDRYRCATVYGAHDILLEIWATVA